MNYKKLKSVELLSELNQLESQVAESFEKQNHVEAPSSEDSITTNLAPTPTPPAKTNNHQIKSESSNPEYQPALGDPKIVDALLSFTSKLKERAAHSKVIQSKKSSTPKVTHSSEEEVIPEIKVKPKKNTYFKRSRVGATIFRSKE